LVKIFTVPVRSGQWEEGSSIKTVIKCAARLNLAFFFLTSIGNCKEQQSATSPFFGEWVNPITVQTNVQSPDSASLKQLHDQPLSYKEAHELYELGLRLFYGTGVEQNYAASREVLNIPASQGHDDSKYYLGLMYLGGFGVVQDSVIAARYFYEGTIKGNAASQYQYGLCLKNGIGAPKDLIEALAVFLKAAQQGHSDAQYEIGLAYRTGNGIAPDYSQAIYWFYKSATQGNISARQNIEEMSKTSTEAKEALDKINYKIPPRKLPTHRPKNRVDTNSIFGGDLPLSLTS
jgi:TPR repeat protein